MWNNLTCVDDFLNRAFHKLGLVVGHHPGYFVIVPVLLACICFTGYQRIHYEIDPEYLFSPINGPSKTERAIVEQYFKVNYSHRFNLGRITRPGKLDLRKGKFFHREKKFHTFSFKFLTFFTPQFFNLPMMQYIHYGNFLFYSNWCWKKLF